jgi:hypothetical protein
MFPSYSFLRLLALLGLLYACCRTTILAQQPTDQAPVIKLGKISPDQFTNSSTDSTAEAVVLYNLGEVSIELSANELWLSSVHHVRILIRKKSAYDRATVQIPVRRGTSGQHEFIRNVEGYTYNLANGQVSIDRLAKTGSFTEKASDQFWIEKFTLPNVREGSIIEYTYTIRTRVFS